MNRSQLHTLGIPVDFRFVLSIEWTLKNIFCFIATKNSSCKFVNAFMPEVMIDEILIG